LLGSLGKGAAEDSTKTPKHTKTTPLSRYLQTLVSRYSLCNRLSLLGAELNLLRAALSGFGTLKAREGTTQQKRTKRTPNAKPQLPRLYCSLLFVAAIALSNCLHNR